MFKVTTDAAKYLLSTWYVLGKKVSLAIVSVYSY